MNDTPIKTVMVNPMKLVVGFIVLFLIFMLLQINTYDEWFMSMAIWSISVAFADFMMTMLLVLIWKDK